MRTLTVLLSYIFITCSDSFWFLCTHHIEETNGVVGGYGSNFVSFKSGVTQGTVLGLLMLLIKCDLILKN